MVELFKKRSHEEDEEGEETTTIKAPKQAIKKQKDNDGKGIKKDSTPSSGKNKDKYNNKKKGAAAVQGGSQSKDEKAKEEMKKLEASGTYSVRKKSATEFNLVKAVKGYNEMSKSQRRVAKREYKAQYDDNVTLIYEIKLVWEKLKLVKLSPEERQPVYDKLFAMAKGKFKDIVVKNDASRVVQSLLKYGKEKEVTTIYNELKDSLEELSKMEYGHFLLIKLLKYVSKEQREQIAKSFFGKVVKMVLRRESGPIIEHIYETGSSQLKSSLIEEFYSDEFALFKSPKARTLNDILKESPAKKQNILSNLGKHLSKLLSTKGENTIKFTIVQRLLCDYFEHSTPDSCAEMAETISEILLPVAHTKDGALVAYYCITYGSPKVRKVVVKSLKDFMSRVAQEEHGNIIISRLFNTTDDTLLLTKSVLSELIADLPNLAVSRFGHLPIVFLMAPGNKQFFTEKHVALHQPTIKSSSGLVHNVGKKDPETRHQELLQFVSPKLIDLCCNNLESLIASQYGIKVVNATLKCATGNKIIFLNKLVDLISTNTEFVDTNARNIQSILKNDYIKTSDLPNNLYKSIKSSFVNDSLEYENVGFMYRDLINLLDETTAKEAKKTVEQSKKKLEAGNKGAKGLVLVLIAKQSQPSTSTTKTTTTTTKIVKEQQKMDIDEEEEEKKEKKSTTPKKSDKKETTTKTVEKKEEKKVEKKSATPKKSTK